MATKKKKEKNLEMPETKTPGWVYGLLLLIAAAIGLLLWMLLGFWGIILTFVILGFTTEIYTATVQGFDAHIVLNHLTGVQRTIFQGMNFKLPWEQVQEEKVDLKVELNEVVKDETYTAKDALMHVKYVYTIRPDVSSEKPEDPEDDPGRKVILYASYEPDAIKMAGRAVFSSRLSDYFARRNGQTLLQKAKITRALFGPGKLVDFEKEHGVKVEVTLEDVDFDEQTQRSRDMLSQATSFDTAVETLVKDGKGMTREEAVRVAKLMNFDDVSETNLNVNVVAPDLVNLRDVTVLGGVGLGDKKGGKK